MTGDMLDELEFDREIAAIIGENDEDITLPKLAKLNRFVARQAFSWSLQCASCKAEIYGNGKKGLLARMDRTENEQRHNRQLINAQWASIGLLVLGIIVAYLRSGGMS